MPFLAFRHEIKTFDSKNSNKSILSQKSCFQTKSVIISKPKRFESKKKSTKRTITVQISVISSQKFLLKIYFSTGKISSLKKFKSENESERTF